MYDKQVKRILAGGLNLLLPSDAIADDEAQELTNFSVDSFGALRSRRGHTLRYSVGGEVVAMTRALGSLWIAAGGNVYKDGAAIISGLSSNRVGLAGYKDFLWAMSEADQRKSDGAENWDWIAEAPEDKPTITAAASVETQVVDFSGGFTVDPAGDETYDPTLTIHNDDDSVWTAEKAVSLNLGTGHSIDDVHEINVWSNKWKHVNEIVYQVDVGDGTFENDYYEARMSLKNINIARREEITFYLRKRPLPVDEAAKDKKRYGSFERVGQSADKDWRSVAAVRIKIDFNKRARVRFNKWNVIGNAENTLEGDDFRVYYTYTTEAEHESNPSPESDPITVNRSGIDVSDMVPSPDPQVVGQNVYLSGGTLGRVLRVNDEPIVGTTYQIRASFDDLTGLGLRLEDDHSDPPVASGLIGPYYGRLIAFGGSTYYWSHISKPYAFAFPDDESRGDRDDVEAEIGDLLAATMRPGMLWLYGTNGVAVVQGDPGDVASAQHRSASQMGIQSAQGVVQSPRGDFAVMSEGAYMFTGDSGQLLSKKIDTIFKGSFNFGNAAVGFRNDVYWVSDGAQTFKWDALTDRWFKDSRLFSAFYSDQGTLIGATTSGEILELDSGFTDDGSAFPVAYKSKAFGAAVDNESTYEDATIWADTGGAILTVTAFLNDGREDQFTVALGTIQSTSEERFVLQFNNALGVKARTCALRITGNVSAECVISKIVLNHYFEAREAKSFDSDEKDFGTHKVKIIRQVYVDLDSPEAAQFILQTDQPNFEMATRDSAHSFAASTTRRGDIYVLPSDFLAHNSRYLLNGEDFRLYGMRALLQVIGTFLHGTKGEFYDSDVIDLGEERVKLYKFIEVEYATAGTAQLEIYTELPSGAQAQVAGSPFTLTGTGGVATSNIQTRLVRLRSTAKGRFIRAKITSTGDFRMEALRFFFKLVGTPGATGWNWASFPVEKTQEAVWKDVFIEPDAIG